MKLQSDYPFWIAELSVLETQQSQPNAAVKLDRVLEKPKSSSQQLRPLHSMCNGHHGYIVSI